MASRGERGGSGARRRRYAVVGALVTLTGPVQPDTLEMTLPQVPGVGWRVQVVQRTLRMEEAARTLQGIATGEVARCLLPWIPLMAGGAEAGLIERWKELASLEPEHRRRGDYGALAVVFAELAECLPAWQQALEGWNMRESQQVLEWQAEARAEGHTKGRAEGQAEGRAEGRAETKRADLLRLVQLRFQTPVPANLAAAVEALTDWEELSRWFDLAATATSLEDFRARVGR